MGLNRTLNHPYNGDVPITPLVIHDLEERTAVGVERYGTPLMAHNGRPSIVDAYQEALDLVMYLRQFIEEHPVCTNATTE